MSAGILSSAITAQAPASSAIFARSFIGKGLSVSIDLPEGQKLITDEKWVVFVILQVLSNFLKYTKQGGITISMSKPNTICIADTGIGISKEDLPRIMQRDLFL